MPADTLIAPAPGAPAPAPTPSPSPRPSPTPSPERPQTSAPDKSEISSEADPAREMDSIFDRVEKGYQKKTDDKSAEEKDKKAEPPTPGDKPKADAKPETKPTAEKKDADPDAKAPKWYRERLEAINSELEELRSSKVSLDAKIKDYESKGKDTTALIAQVESERKEKEAAFGKIRRLTKEHDPAFKEKWEKPLNDEYNYTVDFVKTLHVGAMVEDPDTGVSKWQPLRPAIMDAQNDDFVDLYQLFKKSPVAARAQTEQRFGPAAVDVIDQIKELHRLSRIHQTAKAEEESKWKENETREIADRAVYQESITTASAKARQDIINETLWLYGEDPSDPEGNAKLKEGFEYLDYTPKTFNEQVRALERNKLNAAVVPKLRYLLEKARAELEEFKAADAERKNSGPGKTKRDTTDTASGAGEGKTMLEEMLEVTNA